MKTKILVLIGIAVCAILLTSPVLASAGYSKIYGNANEDNVLDMRDVTYIKLVIFGKKPATTFADANNDGKISMLDVGQTKLIILGKEKQLTLVDQADRTVTVNKPIERVVLVDLLESVRALVQLDAADKIVAINYYIEQRLLDPEKYWSPILPAAPELKGLPSVGKWKDPSIETILAQDPDVVFCRAYAGVEVANTIQESTGTPAVCLDNPGRLDFEIHRLVGKVIGKEKEAEELITYAKEKIDEVTQVTSEIPDSEKPKVYLAFWGEITRTPRFYDPVELAGGINVAEEVEWGGTGYSAVVSKEQVLAWNPDIILIHNPYEEFTVETVLADPDLQIINAVKNHKVYYTKGYMAGWDYGTVVTEVFYMAKLFHPGKFGDLDMEKEGNEILKRFYGVDGLYTEMSEEYNLYTWE